GRLHRRRHLVPAGAGDGRGLCRRALQPRRRAGQDGARRGRGHPLAPLSRAGSGQPLVSDRAVPPRAVRGPARGGRLRRRRGRARRARQARQAGARAVKVLLVGGGGREHTLAWKLAQSSRLTELIAAPGNPGIARLGRCVGIKDDKIEGLCHLALHERVDLTVVGPELPLSLGLADRLRERGGAVFGPSQAAARIESSKAFAKDLMARYSIPTARYRSFTEIAPARAWCRELGVPLVVKADGLAAGKGVIICRTLEEADAALALCLESAAFGAAGASVVVEEFMVGEEASFFAITDGTAILPLAGAQDHKTVFDGDRGPNTGGMGAYSPAPVLDAAMADRVMAEIVRPTVAALAREGTPFTGFLYVGLMIGSDGPRGAADCPQRWPGSRTRRYAWCWPPGGTRAAATRACPSPASRRPRPCPASRSFTPGPRAVTAPSSPRVAASWACTPPDPTCAPRWRPPMPPRIGSSSAASTTGGTSRGGRSTGDHRSPRGRGASGRSGARRGRRGTQGRRHRGL